VTEEQVRALVRAALARHLGTSVTDGSESRAYQPAMHARHDPHDPHDARRAAAHIAHGRFVFLAPTEPDAPCVVEPQVKCHHCGFCQSYGH
jgi:hypothetical protein